MTHTRGLALMAASSAVVALTAAAAWADPYSDVAQAASALRASHITVFDDAEARSGISTSTLAGDLGGAQHIYVAVLPTRALLGTPRATAAAIGKELGDRSGVVVVVVGDQVGAAQGSGVPLPSGEASAIATRAQSSATNVESALETTITQLRAEARVAQGSAQQGGTTYTPPARHASDSGGSSGALPVLLLLGAGGGAAMVVSRRRRARRQAVAEQQAARAEVESLYQRLGHDVSTLSGGDDETARQALADASERFTATGAMLADQVAPVGILAQAKRTAIEGIMAARVARARLGLDPGPDPMPAPPAGAPLVQGSQEVEVDGQTFTGYDSYRPGAGHYFGGGSYRGGYVPGGWYPQPFWQGMAMNALLFGGLGYALGGGLGGFGGGYGYGDAYGSGYDEGYGDGADQGGGDGGWGGGDWAGGGDFGGGGGDFGGGGGDF